MYCLNKAKYCIGLPLCLLFSIAFSCCKTSKSPEYIENESLRNGNLLLTLIAVCQADIKSGKIVTSSNTLGDILDQIMLREEAFKIMRESGTVMASADSITDSSTWLVVFSRNNQVQIYGHGNVTIFQIEPKS